jgi:hypothetical protein
MTQKSEARKERDRQAKAYKEAQVRLAEAQVDGWEELNTVYNTVVSQIHLANTHLAGYTSDKSLYPYIKDASGFSNMLTAHAQDLMQFTEELCQLRAMHAGKTGTIKDLEDFKQIIHISELYDAFQSRYAGVIPPSATNIAEILADAINAKAAAEGAVSAAEEAQNVNVVTDVVVKEEAPNLQAQHSEAQA